MYIISILNNQSKFQMFPLLSGYHIGTIDVQQHGVHTGLCQLLKNILMNI